MKRSKLLALFMAMIMIISAFPNVVFAENEEVIESDISGDSAVIMETTSGTCGDNLTWVLDDNGTLTISGTGAMTNWNNYGSQPPWYSSNESIKKVIINNGVTNIGDYAFDYCTILTSITIPNSVTSIGNQAFFDCVSLTSITIPGSVTSIGEWAFDNCKSLISITIPGSVTSIGDRSFYGCSSLTSINVAQNNKNYSSEEGVLFNKNKTEIIHYPAGKTEKTYTIPGSVTSIGDRSFCDCKSLISITIPDSVTSIGEDAFDDCSSLISITIPNNVTSIRSGVFSGCSSLTSINVAQNNKNYSSEEGVLFNKNKTEIIYYPAGKTEKNYTIPDNVTSIGADAFYKCSSLTSITIPDGVTGIGDNAFFDCSGLISITIPNSVTSIGDNAFFDCSSLTSITIPNSVTSIGDNAFSSCSSLTSITIPNSVTSIGWSVFSGCSSLTSITIPNSVTSIEIYTFCNCSSLTSITIPASVTSIGWGVSSGCRNLTDVYYSGTETQWNNISIGSDNDPLINATKHYISQSGTCGDNLTWVLDYNGTLTISGMGAMTNWDDYTSYAPWKSYRDNIKKVIINNGVTSIGNYAFSSCSSLTSITIPDGVTSIGDEAFYGCSILTSITIPESVTSIGVYAFFDCGSLTSIIIPASVTSIYLGAFKHCDKLTDVYYSGTETQWNNISISSQNDLLINATKHYISQGGTCGDNLTWVLDDNGTLTISGTGAMTDWTKKSYTSTPWYDCRNSIESVIIEDGVTSIGAYAFYYSFKDLLKSVSIPHSVKIIGDGAFYNCTGLTNINISDGVEQIGNSAFAACNGLTSVYIPQSVTTINHISFSGNNLESILVDEKNQYYKSIDGVLFNKEETVIHTYPAGKTETSYTVPDSVTDIRQYAFYSSKLTDIRIPDTVTKIQAYAFRFCDNLKRIVIPESVELIGDGAFSRNGLIEITILSSETEMGSGIFDRCLADFVIKGSTGSTAETYAKENGHTFVSITEGVGGVCGDNLTWTLDSDGTLTISGTGAMTDWSTGSDVPWYSYKENIKKVVINGSVTSIGSHAFSYWSGLTSITIPDSVTSIGARAFRDCSGLTSITIPSSVTYIGIYAFYNCSGLTSITVDKDNKNYVSENGVLFTKDKTIIICYPAGKNDTGYTIPDSVTSIDSYAFSNCSGLTSITIPTSVTSIGSYAFYNCGNLADVYYNSTETQWNNISIGSINDPLKYATKHYSTQPTPTPEPPTPEPPTPEPPTPEPPTPEPLTPEPPTPEPPTPEPPTPEPPTPEPPTPEPPTPEPPTPTPEPPTPTPEPPTPTPEPPTPTPNTSLPDGTIDTSGAISWIFNNDTLTITGNGTMSDYSENSAPWSAGKYQIVHIIIDNGVQNIGAYAFDGLEKVTDIKIPESVSTIGKGSFRNCKALKEITFPQNLTSIGQDAFKNCSSVTVINLPDTVSVIAKSAFEDCTALSEITLPFIGSAAGTRNNIDTFHYIFNTVPASLKKVVITNETDIPENAFKDCAGIQTIIVNDGIKTIGASAFDGCTALSGFEIPSGIDTVPDYTFRNCSSAAVITIPDSVQNIGTAAFDGCAALTAVNIPDGVKEIKDYTFRNCSSLTRIEIPDSTENVRTDILAGCNSLISMKIPFVGANINPSVTEITKEGVLGYFFGESDAKWATKQGNYSFDIPPSLTKIEVTNPDTNSYIAMGAFENCTNICDVIVDGGNKVLDGAFANCRNLRNIYLPKSIDSIGKTILAGCENVETMIVPFIGIDRRDNNTETSVIGAFFGYGEKSKHPYDVKQYYTNQQSYWYYIPASLKNVFVLNQTNIPYGAFMGCYNLEQVSIITGVVIYDYAFYNCKALKNVSLPNDMSEIGYQAFAECESLENVNIPVNAKSIGDSAFYNARALKEIVIPMSVDKIAENVFKGTSFTSDSDAVIVCAENSYAQQYAVDNNIKYRTTDESVINIKRTSTAMATHSDGSYFLDITDTNRLRGDLYVVLYDKSGNMINVKKINAGDSEYRVEFTGKEAENMAEAKIFIWDSVTMQPKVSYAEIRGI